MRSVDGTSSASVTWGSNGQVRLRSSGGRKTESRSRTTSSRPSPSTARYTTGFVGENVAGGPRATVKGVVDASRCHAGPASASGTPVLPHVDRRDERQVGGDAPEGAVTEGPAQAVDLRVQGTRHEQGDPESPLGHGKTLSHAGVRTRGLGYRAGNFPARH